MEGPSVVSRAKQGGGKADSVLPNVNRVSRLRLADQIISELQTAITSGELKVGDRLPPEPVLMERFGVGRSTVREAVRALVHSGVLRVQVGDGTYVSATPGAGDTLTDKIRRASIAELFDVRRAFEMSVAGLAARNRSEKDLLQLREAAQACEVAAQHDDPEAFVEADYAFHMQIAAATKNVLLVDLYGELRGAVRTQLREQPDVTDGISHHALTLHNKLLKALQDKDSRAAERIWAATPNPYLVNE
ncbi:MULTISPECIES: FadR/GntR family transcriptional regulator [unclassified Mycolicibacterium]|uniref:FadR/GntR family transcriptional regulator n=1 Tax=unclassified Mycolicibacterium TaxID=2636767 RepID=UPI002ED9FA08